MNLRKLDISDFLEKPRSILVEPWSTLEFESEKYTEFARTEMIEETRSGVRTLAALFLLPMLGISILAPQLGLDRIYSYGFLALAGLAIHIHLSSRAVREIEALYLLGMVLLVVSGTTFVLIAHRTGALGTVIFASVGLLFMAIPSMPWGLREGTIAASMIYGLFTASTWSVADRFPIETLWTLQIYMAAAAIVSTTLVARTALVRKRGLTMRFDLERTKNELETLSLQDSLTGAWNRRYLEIEFPSVSRIEERKGRQAHFAFVDLDDFKLINDRYGHLYGDQVLRWVARALEAATQDGGFVARIGGDEFACLLLGTDGVAHLHKSIEALAELVRSSGESDRPAPTFSAGLVQLPDDRDCDLEEACEAADSALYDGKKVGRERPTTSTIVSLSLNESAVNGQYE